MSYDLQGFPRRFRENAHEMTSQKKEESDGEGERKNDEGEVRPQEEKEEVEGKGGGSSSWEDHQEVTVGKEGGGEKGNGDHHQGKEEEKKEKGGGEGGRWDHLRGKGGWRGALQQDGGKGRRGESGEFSGESMSGKEEGKGYPYKHTFYCHTESPPAPESTQ